MPPPQKTDPTHFSADTRLFIALLHRHGVRYVIVAGEAVIFHGYARYTGGVDFLYERSEANLKALYSALAGFWEGDIPGLSSPVELLDDAVVIQFGRPPNRIDLISSIKGVAFDEAWNTRITADIQAESEGTPVPVYILSLDSLIKNQAATARAKDLDDLRYLRRAAEHPSATGEAAEPL